jgi:hypothetical protein
MDDRKEIIVAKSIAFTLFSLNVKEKNGDNRGEIVEELLDRRGERRKCRGALQPLILSI